MIDDKIQTDKTENLAAKNQWLEKKKSQCSNQWFSFE